MIEVRDRRLLWASGALRRKVAECERLARDVKVRLVYEELRLRGERYNEAVRLVCARFSISPSTAKRAIRTLTPASERRDPPPCRPPAPNKRRP